MRKYADPYLSTSLYGVGNRFSCRLNLAGSHLTAPHDFQSERAECKAGTTLRLPSACTAKAVLLAVTDLLGFEHKKTEKSLWLPCGQRRRLEMLHAFEHHPFVDPYLHTNRPKFRRCVAPCKLDIRTERLEGDVSLLKELVTGNFCAIETSGYCYFYSHGSPLHCLL